MAELVGGEGGAETATCRAYTISSIPIWKQDVISAGGGVAVDKTRPSDQAIQLYTVVAFVRVSLFGICESHLVREFHCFNVRSSSHLRFLLFTNKPELLITIVLQN